jgi:hypothetical protein
MPTLTYQTSTGTHCGRLNGRVLIGRKLSYGISLGDPAVSRLHAWIDPDASVEADGWILVDTGSRTGTFVNDRQITRHLLKDGDAIRVGGNLLHYSAKDDLPDGLILQAWTAPSEVIRKDGILFQCACGAPLWVGNDLAGKRGICRHCRQPVTVPPLHAPESAQAEGRTTPTPAPAESRVASSPAPVENRVASSPAPAESRAAPPPGSTPAEPATKVENKIEAANPSTSPAAEPLGSLLAQESKPAGASSDLAFAAHVQNEGDKPRKCSTCHSPIAAGESFVSCPDCAMHYHAECWQENFGCSTYGCAKVNCLKPDETPALPAAASASHESSTELAPPAVPWEVMLFAASIGSLLGALLFGGLSAIVVIGCLVVMIRRRPRRWGLLIAALMIGCAGIAVGLVLSDFWYFSSRHTPELIARHLHF